MSGPLKGMAFTIAERLLARRTAAFVAVSPHEVELCHMAKPDKETFLVPNIPSVAPSLTDNVTPPTGEIVMVGRLSEQKDPGLFASIARLSRQTHPGWRFVWVGDGDPTMRAELVKAGVEVTGWVTADEVSSRLRASFAYLHTAAWEGFPLSVLDALASKTPVLVRDIVAFDGVSLAKFSTAEQATSILTELTTKGVRARNILQGAEILESMNSAVQSSVLSECYDAVCNTRELAHA
jgi:glycosyltransferase involved in cell wall biosynthesis